MEMLFTNDGIDLQSSMKGAKRVRFRDTEVDRSQSGRSEAASALSHEPKTSEFAFFKKFREDASLKHLSKSPSRGNIQLKHHSKGKNHGGGDSSSATSHGGEVTDNQKFLSSSLFAENARPRKTDLRLSPQFVSLRRSEQGDKNPVSSSVIKTNSHEENLEFSCLIKTPPSSGPDDFFLERATESVISDTRYKDGDIFSKKRAKLQSWVAKTMFPRNNEILKGCDMISLLLNRLLPEGSESNHSEALKLRPDKRETDYQSVYIPKPDYQLKKTRTDRNLVKYEEPYYMDAGATSSWPKKFHRSFLLEGPVGSACLPTIEWADQIALGHQDREIEPSYFSNIDYKQSWDNKIAEAFEEENAKSYSSFGVYNPSRMSLEYEPIQGHFLNDNPSSSWYYRLDNTLTAQKGFLLNAESSTACMDNYDNKFLLEYEKREPEWVANNTEAPSFDSLLNSAFGDSSGKCRSSALTTLMELDQSIDDLGHFGAFRRKPSNLLMGWDLERLNENETIPSFPSTELMHYQQNPETTTYPDHSVYSSSFLPMSSAHAPSYLDNAFQWFDTRNNYVITRSHPPFCTPRQLIPAENGFFHPPRHQCLIEEITPQRSCPPKETILCSASTSTKYLPLHDYHALQAPAISYSSPYLLLEGSKYTCGQSSEVSMN